MNPSSPPHFRLDCMGDFGDDGQRPAKRVRLDQAADGHGAPPPDGNFRDAWGSSPSTDQEWLFPNAIITHGSLPMPVSGSIASVMPHSNTILPINSSMVPPTLPLIDSSIAPPWNTSFNVPAIAADISAMFPPQPQHVILPLEQSQPSQHAPRPPSQSTSYSQSSLQLQHSRQSHPTPRLQPQRRPRQTLPSRSPPVVSEPTHQEQRRRKARPKYNTSSPFSDCIDSFGHTFSPQQFSRPVDGKVNGYIKFAWSQSQERPSSRVVEVTDLEDDTPTTSVAISHTPNHGYDLALQHCRATSASTPTVSPPTGSDSPCSTASTLVSSQNGAYLPSPTGSVAPYLEFDKRVKPRYLPSHFGLNTVMDSMDRKLFKFYVHNWCPGRSVLKNTNLWLTDFARLHGSVGVLAAIQSLAGIYIHDYLPDEIVRRRINERFAVAEARFSQLLADMQNLNEVESSELITLASLLSMQDVVLTERRVKKPCHPRWLTGFRQAENMLELTDPGNRFYKESNVQVDALRLSQSVIVGRAVILAQPMMPLPSGATFDAVAETRRFGFLLYGSEQDMYEIHGGCGFSKRLLHIFNQVTHCTARILQDGETPIVPVTAQMLFDQVSNLNQWSGEHDDWETAQHRNQQPIEWIRQKDETYVVQDAKEMTEVTAEAWRLAGMLYLQCRLFRLPRNHPEVVSNLADLAKSIAIMPTSGLVFTAQAPLLPVFFLGLLATVPDHAEVAHAWFQQVIHTPVRSSVPPLYQALKRIHTWMDHEVPVPSRNTELSQAIAERPPWWERMVSKIHEKEMEVLCLT
ncbi:zinc finger-like protein [Cordyceps javanica]|uniref:Zinc finger-like protein n=1 Tax=Cordyceps javanica TaxID=43265 RepID=A0A545W599_9HYPO|nr:zinc finger-like protein [Cordyceps javanica]TQW09154.1 zinc finger-like protein [Cordyceps javanica]